MNEIVNNFLFIGDNLMPKFHLESQDLLIVFVNRLPNILKQLKNSQKHDLNYIYKNELDKACSAHADVYADIKI